MLGVHLDFKSDEEKLTSHFSPVVNAPVSAEGSLTIAGEFDPDLLDPSSAVYQSMASGLIDGVS